jgi:hypothetical protein
MRVSHRYRFVFLSNPRCGSTSLRKMLLPYSDLSSTTNKYPYHHHTNAKALRRVFVEKGWDWDRYTVFTTIRNPWDRIVSMWEFADVTPESVWATHRRATESFDRFVFGLPEYMERLFAERHAPTGMTSIVISQFADETVQVFRLETLAEKLPPLLSDLGLPAVNIPHVNATIHRPYRAYYNWRTRRAVARFMAPDIEVGQYRF